MEILNSGTAYSQDRSFQWINC